MHMKLNKQYLSFLKSSMLRVTTINQRNGISLGHLGGQTHKLFFISH